jgi:hypothetical protein
LYLEQYADDKKKLDSLIMDISISKPKQVCGVRISSTKKHDEEYNFDYAENIIEIAIGGNLEEMKTYINGMHYTSQTVKTKDLGVDTACYQLSVDDNYDEFHTGADGYWGGVYTFKRANRIDGYYIDIAMPEDLSFEDMQKYVEYFFDEVQKADLTMES